ncbi:hypothetical protein [Chryseobacterium balustinum]|uniref:Uncharacterized protein n=2 Tax=Chryseobacterium balustinum TaxID=246 RepID=A0AAX2IH35_9FLAO|nr:hypothetical protein [Chryseobacterium balustinum]AZB28658.1 hypothetical protein EB354_04930 [Chryseobacterium balustinum]SQA87705.1 Uncharacterised protein [Chryseobacterium balustinum]
MKTLLNFLISNVYFLLTIYTVTEERKKNGLFEDIIKFEERMTNYYSNRKDKEILNVGLDKIYDLESSKKITF